MKYPLFDDAEGYLKKRRGSCLLGFFKRRDEQQALNRCLTVIPDISLVCDAPCGPGSLFSYWRRKGLKVIGVDFSMPMVTRASEELCRLNLNGYVLYGDIFLLPELLRETPDLVASVRFIYAFEKAQRIKLLQILASASNRYVLIQYKTMQTFRGWVNLNRKNRQLMHPTKLFLSFQQIEEELGEAGLASLNLIPINQWSDRVFVIAEKNSVNRMA